MDPREYELLRNKDREPVLPSGKPVSRKKQNKRRYQDSQ